MPGHADPARHGLATKRPDATQCRWPDTGAQGGSRGVTWSDAPRSRAAPRARAPAASTFDHAPVAITARAPSTSPPIGGAAPWKLPSAPRRNPIRGGPAALGPERAGVLADAGAEIAPGSSAEPSLAEEHPEADAGAERRIEAPQLRPGNLLPGEAGLGAQAPPEHPGCEGLAGTRIREEVAGALQEALGRRAGRERPVLRQRVGEGAARARGRRGRRPPRVRWPRDAQEPRREARQVSPAQEERAVATAVEDEARRQGDEARATVTGTTGALPASTPALP